MEKGIKVAVLMGSKSDMDVMKNTTDILSQFKIPYDCKIVSAHRTPDLLDEFIYDALARGAKVFIAGAGCSAHLAGVVASKTTYPVIGVPLGGSALNGFDSLLSTVQMPGGVPVATVAIGSAGAKNAGLLAIQILSIADEKLQESLKNDRAKMKEKIDQDNK